MNLDQVKSAAAPILAALGTVGVVVGVITPDQLAAVKGDLAQMWQGVQLIISGGSGLLIVGAIVVATVRRTVPALVASLKAQPGGKAAMITAVTSSHSEQVVTTDKSVAAAIPGVTLAPALPAPTPSPAAPKA